VPSEPSRSTRRGSDANKRRRVAAQRRRLAGGEADLAHRHRVARHRVHHEQHVGALRAERFGDRHRGQRRLEAQHRRGVGRAGDHHALLQTFLAERFGDELADLAAAFADQRDHVHLAGLAARDGAHQGRLADARTGEDADALALAERQHAVDRGDAGLDRLVDRGTRQRRRRIAGQRAQSALDRRPAVERPAERVDDAAEQTGPDRHRQRPMVVVHLVPRRHAVRVAERHHHCVVAVEPDHLGGQRQLAAVGVDRAGVADRRASPVTWTAMPRIARTRPSARGRLSVRAAATARASDAGRVTNRPRDELRR
jgi:hypothetical protein